MIPLETAGWELFFVLAVGAAFIVGSAWIILTRIQSGIWQRATWLIALFACIAIAVMEIAGAGHVVAQKTQEFLGLEQRVSTPSESAQASSPKYQAVATVNDLSSPMPTTSVATTSHHLATASVSDHTTDITPPAISSTTPNVPVEQQNSATAAWDKLRGHAWLFLVLWLLVAIALGGRLAWGQWTIRRFTQELALCTDGAIYQRVRQVAARLGLQRMPRVRIANGGASPLVCGLRRPTLVLPQRFTNDYSVAEQTAMLAHELGHVAGRDPLWQFVADLFCCGLWWHPAAYVLRRQLRAACETAADETSLTQDAGPETLAVCLIQLGRRLARGRQPAVVGVVGSGYRSGLGKRVSRLLQLQGRPWIQPARWRLVIVGMVSVALCVGGTTLGTLWARPALTTSGDSTMQSFRGSWRTSLAGAALLAFFNVAVAEDGPPKGEGKAPEVRRENAPPGEGGPIREKIREAREKIAKLREEGKNDEAAAMEQKLREAMGRLQGEGNPRPFAQLPPEAQEKMRDIGEAMKKAREAGNEEELKALQQKAREIMGKFAPNAEGGPRPGQPAPQDMREKMREMREALVKAREAGNAEEAKKIEEKMRAAMQEFQKANAPRDGERPNPDARRPEGDRPNPETRRPEGDRPNPEARRPEGAPRDGEGPRAQLERMRLIMEAAERLRQAGLTKEADELIRRAREQGPQDGQRRDGEQPRRDGDAPRGEGRLNPVPGEGRPDGAPRGEGRLNPVPGEGRPNPNGPNATPNDDMLRIIRELRNEVEQLRRELNDVRSKR